MPIILFTGLSSSGKSQLAGRLAESLQIPVLGERETLHSLAVSSGFARSRHWLSAVGFQRVLDESLVATLNAIDNQRTPLGLILDGSYDRRLPDAIRRRFPEENVVIVAVEITQQTREERNRERMQIDARTARQELDMLDQLKYQAGMQEIIGQAHIVVKNEKPLQESVRELQDQLAAKFGQSTPSRERR